MPDWLRPSQLVHEQKLGSKSGAKLSIELGIVAFPECSRWFLTYVSQGFGVMAWALHAEQAKYGSSLGMLVLSQLTLCMGLRAI